MKEYQGKNLRNVGIVAHGSAGKTSLIEAILYDCGKTDRLGSIEAGNTVTDYTPDEVKRKISIDATPAYTEWKDCKINLVDTPGYTDFTGDAKSVLRVMDSAVIVVDSTTGMGVGTEKVWQYAVDYGLPRLVFINKLDKVEDYSGLIKEMEQVWSAKFVPLQIPVGKESDFRGVIDLLQEKAIVYGEPGSGKFTVEEIPQELRSAVNAAQEILIESAAESDDTLVEKYLEEGTLSGDEIRQGLITGVGKGELIPILYGSATVNIGIHALLDVIVDLLPSPVDRGPVVGFKPSSNEEESREPKDDAPFCAYVFKTVSEPHLGELAYFRVYAGTISSGSDAFNPGKGITERVGQLLVPMGKNRNEVNILHAGDIGGVAKLKQTTTGDTLCDGRKPVQLAAAELPQAVISVAVKPNTKKDQEKLGESLARIMVQDPTLKVHVNREFSQTIVAGLGELHLEVVIDRLKERFGVGVTLEKARVAYRETIRKGAKAQGKYKRQSGGRGQYGDVWLEVEPLPRGQEYEFVDKIVGGAIPGKYIPAVEKGVKEAISRGIQAGYPVTDLKVSVYDGSFHQVDSSDLAFQIAGSMAFRKAAMEANPVLLEPIMEVEVVVPEAYLGDITGDLNSRRGRIIGIEARGSNQLIKASIPLAELDRYSTDLKSMTQGRGSYSMKFSHYEEVPARISEKIIAEAKQKAEKET